MESTEGNVKLVAKLKLIRAKAAQLAEYRKNHSREEVKKRIKERCRKYTNDFVRRLTQVKAKTRIYDLENVEGNTALVLKLKRNRTEALQREEYRKTHTKEELSQFKKDQIQNRNRLKIKSARTKSKKTYQKKSLEAQLILIRAEYQ